MFVTIQKTIHDLRSNGILIRNLRWISPPKWKIGYFFYSESYLENFENKMAKFQQYNRLTDAEKARKNERVAYTQLGLAENIPCKLAEECENERVAYTQLGLAENIPCKLAEECEVLLTAAISSVSWSISSNKFSLHQLI
ncbi:hypothetical protein F2Q70_00044451 [Brassica cretica]|uniref:Uncharacterized protein n=1 Tax=Brassica cretica TaxID=69181 RepID=A0A8S9LLY3_BRACR|nr:hypothetical protein F2Q70_00044451 [Brassica cretica]KAF2606518.1 hypothetical protein F2Q68_00045400 [Brassica cretica]